MRVFGLVFIIVGFAIFGGILAGKLDNDLEKMDNSVAHSSDCSKFTEFECIARSGCSPVYDENTNRALAQGLPTHTQGKGLNKVTIGGIFLTCEPDIITTNS